MIITTALTVSTAAFAVAWVIERQARRRAESKRSLAEATNALLRVDCERLTARVKAAQAATEALEHLENTAQVTDYNGLPVYTWSLSSPYPTLAEAVRHVPARR